MFKPIKNHGRDNSKVSTFLHTDVFTAFWSFPSYLDHYLNLLLDAEKSLGQYNTSSINTCYACHGIAILTNKVSVLDPPPKDEPTGGDKSRRI